MGGAAAAATRVQLAAGRGANLVAKVAAHVLGGGEEAAVVLLRLEDDNVAAREEEKEERKERAEADAKAQGCDLVVAAQVDGHKGNPNNERRVHGEADELCLVEIFRHISGLESVKSAHCN